MKLIIAIITLALAVASTSAISHVKVTCTSVNYGKYIYTGKTDCSGQGFMQAAFKPDVCVNTNSLLADDKSAKFAYNATSKWFTQTGYDKTDCAGTAKTSWLLNPSKIKLDTCTKDASGANSYKIVAVSQAVDYHLSDDSCSGLSIYMGSGECYTNTKITCC